MASQDNGGLSVPGNLNVFGDADVNGDANIDGTLTGITANLTALNVSTRIKLTPTASPPAGAAEGMLYADTDNKLYYYNGTDWKEVAFV